MPPLTSIETATSEEFTLRAVAFIADVIRSSIATRNRCLLGLSGGKTPAPVYESLGKEPDIDWSKVWIFLVDDRFIRRDSPLSNQFLLRSTLLRTATIPESQILCPDTSLALPACIDEYDRVITAALGKNAPDLLVLGMGQDGHIASLFPPLSAEALGSRAVIGTTTDSFDVPKRISLTLPALQKSRGALFLLSGSEKKRVWEEMMESAEDSKRWPAKGIVSSCTSTVIFGG